MYSVAGQLDPDSYLTLARATYAEMALAGITCVGEFHYLHHGPDGTPYDDPNAMGHALYRGGRGRRDPADPAGRVLSQGRSHAGGSPAAGAARSAGSATGTSSSGRPGSRCWSRATRCGSGSRPTRCARSRRSTSAGSRPWAARCTSTCPSSRPRTTPAGASTCAARPSCSTSRTRSVIGSPRSTAPTSASATAKLLGSSGTNVCFTPTTERDLADGIGPATRAARRRRRADPRQRPARGDRSVRGGPRPRAGRAAEHVAARAVPARASWSGP